jgi:hypothetical protein
MRRLIPAWVALCLCSTISFAQEEEALKPVWMAFNSTGDESEPFAVTYGPNSARIYYLHDKELYYSAKGNDVWLPGKPFTDIQERGEIGGIFIALPKTGQFPQQIIYSIKHEKEGSNGPEENFDLYIRTRQGGKGPDMNVPIPLHHVDTEDDEMHPWLTADGKLYFSRKTKEGWRIFVARRMKDNIQFDKPVMVILPLGFHHPTLSPNGQTMYLQGPLENNRSGIFRSVYENGKWSEPEELKNLNHPGGKKGDLAPSLSHDGSMLYFASDRPGGKGKLDIYMVGTAQLKKKQEK